MIKSAESRNLILSQNILSKSEKVKRKSNDDLTDHNNNEKITKKIKLFENKSNDYVTKEFDFEI
ncbi:hypothetical protein C1645_818735 [Glomus cerebriforme]|uniref:Uncharacterized protein n=1 Tax=Glomus cerebriforme TaxID=658196 RepID=A0A397TG32_9GLOM|nr:hypothetical protein C1645_818735 [Glomus cerebriforme]